MITALFRKELRQHGRLALAIIGACFFFHGCAYGTSKENMLELNVLLNIALFASFFYVGAAAACVYVAEHDENTFGFLRKLPVAPHIDVGEFLFLCRIIIAAVVAGLALWGMLHWFKYDQKRSFLFRHLTGNLVLFRYPKRIQSPFFALWHQHIRSASIVYPLGLLCFALMSFLCIYFSFLRTMSDGWLAIAWQGSIFGIILFWGTIFGADQRNHSYRFLMRLGIHEGTLWWSRLTMPFLFYIPVVLSALFLQYSLMMEDHDTGSIQWLVSLFLGMMTIISLWFVPVAAGAFCSIYFRHQVMSVFVTFFVFLGVLIWLMVCSFHSATTFTVPVYLLTVFLCCFILLDASRRRARYWLRDM